ncbi:monooxygenase [Phytohabitans aurantiacus]|uniref:Monooxygenase n=1 Tax=Phytohabitans aurantiacus TaxID=3016789 RepID=A0ABQ5QZS0_9ACTN|nr:monooxygenase [Phytohabitans aurantiacus]
MSVVDGRVIVAGGGIAGLAAARALHQRDIPALVVDRLASQPDAGLAINLPGNAVRALGALGLADGIAALGTPTRRREYRNAKGKLLFAMDEDAFWGEEARPRCVRRADLLALLARDLPAGTVRWNSAVTAVRATAERAEVSLAGGTIEQGALVVGADGVRSVVRDAVLGEGAAPRAALLSAASWRFMAPNPGVEYWTAWSGAEGTFLLIPVDNDEVYGYASATRGGPVAPDPAWLSTTFGRFPDPVLRVLATVLDGERANLYHSPIEEVRIPSWSRGRAVLIGDAAHATAPVWAQGAALAVEDALALAELLATRDDWSEVGAEYERIRRPRVTHVQEMTDRLSRTAGLPIWIRDRILPFVGPRTYRETYGPLLTPG